MKRMTCYAATSRKLISPIRLTSMCSAFLVALSLFGCATTTSPPKSVDKPITDLLRSRPLLHIAVYPPTSFVASGMDATPFYTALGLSGGLLPSLMSSWGQAKAGEQFRRDFAVDDPTLRLRDSVAAGLRSRLANSEVRITEAPLDTERPEDLRTLLGDSLLLSFKTTDWSLYPADFVASSHGHRYGIRYVVQGRLTDVVESRIMWEDECVYDEADAENYGPFFKDVTANNAAILKATLTRASDYCAAAIVQALLGERHGR